MSSPCKKWEQKLDNSSLNGPVDLIETVNKLQDKLAVSGTPLEVSLPQIVVVGSQSAGKSSTLENIVGREFLPRGTENFYLVVVTRRPTVVQLLPCEEEYAMFLHKPKVKFTDFHDVKAEIIEETNRNPGPVGFSSVPISLKIYSPKVLKLTVVDLPGLIRVTVDNQSEDSIKEIRNIVLEYISQPNCLILAVSPANQDIANSDALEIAKIVDPERSRTIGVLTKLDLMDEGTDARDVLENKKIPLVRGYIGVLNRSQKDIEDGKDINYCLEKETRFFATTPYYKDMAHRMGTMYLRKTLNEQLYIHIKEYMPAVRKELTDKIEKVRKELKEINAKLSFNFNEPAGIHSFMINLTQKFIEHFHTEIFGHSISVSMNELSAGAMINFKLYKNIQNFKIPEIPSQEKLLTTIANLHGIRNCFSMPSLALETVANQLLMLYIEPLNLLVDDIADTLVSTAENSSNVLNSYPNFRGELIFFIRNSISEAAVETKVTLEKHLRAEMYFVNTYHKDFAFPELGANESLYPIKLWGNTSTKKEYIYYSNSVVPSSAIKNEESDLSEALESIEADKSANANGDTLAKTLERYISMQQKHIEDMAFKYILYFLVKQVMDFVKSDLLGKMLVAVNKEIIIKDCNEDFNKIKALESTCLCLEDTLNAVQSF